MLNIQNLSKTFGGVKAVQNVDLDVSKGSIHSVIGPNGAGKTTLLNLMTGRVGQARDESHVSKPANLHEYECDRKRHGGGASAPEL